MVDEWNEVIDRLILIHLFASPPTPRNFHFTAIVKNSEIEQIYFQFIFIVVVSESVSQSILIVRILCIPYISFSYPHTEYFADDAEIDLIQSIICFNVLCLSLYIIISSIIPIILIAIVYHSI